MRKKINWVNLIILLIIPQLVGLIGNLLGNASMGYYQLVKPEFTPPAIVFAIVWPILYLLMGIASYIILSSESNEKGSALLFYFLQLAANMLWPLFFFMLQWLWFSFFWLLLIILLTFIAVIKFFKISKWAGLLMIPYLIWLVFAGILNAAISLLNT